MNQLKINDQTGMNRPAIYRIEVEGKLESDWSDRVQEMNITEASGTNTVLVGRLKDQAALTGVLNTLYDLHMPVVSVDCLENG